MSSAPPPDQPAEDRLLARSPAWYTYRDAVNKGWGATARLCLILVVRWGAPVAGGVKLAGLILAHVH